MPYVKTYKNESLLYLFTEGVLWFVLHKVKKNMCIAATSADKTEQTVHTGDITHVSRENNISVSQTSRVTNHQ